MRQVSGKKKIQEKEAEELRNNKGAENPEKYVNKKTAVLQYYNEQYLTTQI